MKAFFSFSNISEGTTPPGPIYGCTDPAADNYNPAATADDGSCIYAPGPLLPPTGLTAQEITSLDISGNFDYTLPFVVY